MTEKRFTLQMDTEWWFVGDNTIKVNEFGYRDDLTGEDKYRGLKQDLTEQEVVDLLNEQDQRIKELTNFKNKVFTILDKEWEKTEEYNHVDTAKYYARKQLLQDLKKELEE